MYNVHDENLEREHNKCIVHSYKVVNIFVKRLLIYEYQLIRKNAGNVIVQIDRTRNCDIRSENKWKQNRRNEKNK